MSLAEHNRLILAIGSRIGDRLEAVGHKCEACFPLPSSILGITAIIQEMVLILEQWRQEKQVDQIIVIYNRIVNGSTYRPTDLQIFPLNLERLKKLPQQKWTSRSLPTFTMSQDKLATVLFRQYFFVSLYRACAESLKSENTSRLAGMQMAETNIAERLSELNMEFNHQRQTTITEELLDIVSGFEALTN
ncbi:MAG: F0F1 ATP synthase subunit gamma [Xenococcus sp. MO_188.B8]|nr:F0F1 ATP synthase subunit gamma [Xenococcus sp. MO_188.B8]